MAKKLEVSPAELYTTAGRIDEHAEAFMTTHQTTLWRVGEAALGVGLAGAALPEMLTAWQTDGARFIQHFTHHAEGHRNAADAYVETDTGSAESISDTGSAL